MATIDYWAEAPMHREQIALFAPTLDSAIADDDPVRLFDEVLAGVDWSEWEGEYHGRLAMTLGLSSASQNAWQVCVTSANSSCESSRA